MVQFSKNITLIPNKQTTNSAVDIAGYGLYTAFVDTKKGPQTPVRRSCRGARRSPYCRDRNKNYYSPAENQPERSIHREFDSDEEEASTGSLLQEDLSVCEEGAEDFVEETTFKVNLKDSFRDEKHNLKENTNLTVVDEDDLCATFEVKLTVGKNDLKVKNCTASLVSPKPQLGRCITVKEVGSNPIHLFSPVMRSTRKSFE